MPSTMKGMPSKAASHMAKSMGGAGAPMATPAGAVPDMQALKKGDWGKLRPQLAKDLSKGQGEAIAADYREAVETYYRVIAEKSKKP